MHDLRTKRFSTLHMATALAVSWVALSALTAIARTVSVPYTFTAGTVISAQEMNANFAAMEDAISAMEERLAVLDYFTVREGTMDRLPGPHIIITGANLHVRNGTGSTVEKNGLGNVVIGYNVNPGGSTSRTGSHVLVVGDKHTFDAAPGVVFGDENELEENGFAVLGGAKNQSTQPRSVVVGGRVNSAAAPDSVVVAGRYNGTYGSTSAIVGGQDNRTFANSYAGVVVGGRVNHVDGGSGVILGGTNNETTEADSTHLGDDPVSGQGALSVEALEIRGP